MWSWCFICCCFSRCWCLSNCCCCAFFCSFNSFTCCWCRSSCSRWDLTNWLTWSCFFRIISRSKFVISLLWLYSIFPHPSVIITLSRCFTIYFMAESSNPFSLLTWAKMAIWAELEMLRICRRRLNRKFLTVVTSYFSARPKSSLKKY